MPKILQFRRGTTAELNSIAGAVGELFVDTTKDTVVVMDGSTPGGFPLQRELVSGSSIKTINGQSILGNGDITITGGSGFSGNYNDLTNKPTLFSGNYNDLTNKPVLAIVATSGSYNDLTNKPTIPSLSGYATESYVNTQVSGKQDTLISNLNIKTVNGQSILGSGNIDISISGVDVSSFATKTDLLLLSTDDIDEGDNLFFTNDRVQAYLDSIGGGSGGGASEVDTITVRSSVTLQSETKPLGVVVSKSTVPPTTEYKEYVSTQTNNQTTEVIASQLDFNYGWFYGSYADIYAFSNNTQIKKLFAIGNTVRITKNGHWWDLQITNWGSNSNTYLNVSYNVTPGPSASANGWNTPNAFDSYYSWSQNIAFSSNLPVPEKYVLTLDSDVPALTTNDKLLINDELNATPYNVSTSTKGTWDYGLTSNGTSYTVTFGSSSWYGDTQPLRDLLQVGNTITFQSNTGWGTGTYLVVSRGNDTVWNTTYGISVTFQYVSGVNFPQSYTSMSDMFNNYLGTVSGVVTPNYTTEYIDQFATLNNSTSYISFSNYDFVSIGDTLSYIPAITSIQFKDDAGNKVKAISYNNSTGKITYDGIEQTLVIDSNNNVYSSNIDLSSPLNHTDSVAIGKIARTNGEAGVAIGRNAQAANAAVSIGRNSNASSIYGISIGDNSGASTFGVAVGYNSYSSSGVAIGANASSNDGVALRGYAPGQRAVAIGTLADASQNSQFTICTATGTEFRNQTTTLFFSDGNLTNPGVTYLFASNGGANSTRSSVSTSNTYSIDIGNRFNKTQRMMLYGTAIVMFKPTNDSSVDDSKVVEIKMVIRSTSSNTFAMDIISTNNIFAGSGALHPNWTPSFELTQNRYLNFKVDKGTDSTNLGVLCKLEFQVLHTA